MLPNRRCVRHSGRGDVQVVEGDKVEGDNQSPSIQTSLIGTTRVTAQGVETALVECALSPPGTVAPTLVQVSWMASTIHRDRDDRATAERLFPGAKETKSWVEALPSRGLVHRES